MKLNIWYLLALFLLAHIGLSSQEYTISSFTKSNGLPSDYCYNSAQDAAGFIWLSTEAGLCTFDGHHFQTDLFPLLAGKEIFRIYKDTWGRIWFNELSGELYYLEDGKLNQLQYPKENSEQSIVDICDDQIGHIWITQRKGFKAIGLNAEDLSVKYIANNTKDQLNILKKLGVFRYPEQISLQGNSFMYLQKEVNFEFKDFDVFKFFSNQVKYNEDLQIFFYEDKLYYYDYTTGHIHSILEKYQPYFDKGIVNITLDRHKNLWLAVRSGFYRIKNPLSDSSELKVYFENINGGHITIDNQDNLWFSTINEGILKLSETEIKNIHDDKTRNITSILNQFGYMIYGTDKGEVVVKNSENKVMYTEQIEDQATLIYDIKPIGNDKVLITSNKELNILDLRTFSNTCLQENGYYKSASAFKNRIWINGGQNNYLTSLDSNKVQFVKPNQRSYCNLIISDQEAYIGTIRGLYRSHVNGTTRQILPDVIKEDIKAINYAADSTLWIGTHGNGIYILQKDTLLHHLTNLPSKHIRDIKKNRNNMWVATGNGLCKIKKVNDRYICKVLDKSDGLSSDEINSLCITDNTVYAANTNGISVINANIKFDNDIPIVKIDNIKINERDTVILETYNLNEEQRNVKISFGGILFNKPTSIVYRYKMSGVDSDWINTDNRIAQYPSLSAGKYEFLLKAKSLNSRWSPIKMVKFDIPNRFVESQIYKVLIVIISSIFLLVCFSFLSRNRERKRQFKLTQMTALRAQMNPHFIFNSLNSVQDYILRDDKRAANKYISNFSKLMRYILNASDKEFTNLKEEIDALDLYLSIEAMRFDNALEFIIHVDSDLDPQKYEIPTMILQPYLENAINHGLKHSKEDKRLKISVQKYSAGLKIEIYDNGVGRKRSRKINMLNQDSYESKGNLIIQKRISLLNRHYQKENKITYEDIYDKNGNPTGTKVEILLQSIKLS